MLFNCERDSGKHQHLKYRARETCNAHNIAFIKYVFDDKYARAYKTTISTPPVQTDGVTDSVVDNNLLVVCAIIK